MAKQEKQSKGGKAKAATKNRVRVSVFADAIKTADGLRKPKVIKYGTAGEAHAAAYAFWGARRRAGLSKTVGVSLDQEKHTVTIGPKALVAANPKAVKGSKARKEQAQARKEAAG
jgi:hypothetical protein